MCRKATDSKDGLLLVEGMCCVPYVHHVWSKKKKKKFTYLPKKHGIFFYFNTKVNIFVYTTDKALEYMHTCIHRGGEYR